MKKLIMMVSSAVLSAALPTMADTEKVGDYTWTYSITGDTAEIGNGYFSAISPSPTGSVTIPSTLGGKLVTSIGDSAFDNCSGLTSVTIPDGVTSIGDGAFAMCEGLTSVTIPDGVTSIGVSAFINCTNLTSVTIPDSVTNISCASDIIYGNSFFGCSGLRNVVVPQYVCSNGLSSVFPAAYQNITNVIILDGTTSIGDSAFYNCTNLTSVTMPNSVTNIGDRAFADCSALETVTVPQYVLDVGVGNVFCRRDSWGYESRLENPLDITLADGVTSIPYSAFAESYAPKVKRLSIPATVTSISTSCYADRGLRNLSDSDSPVEIVIAPDNDNYKFVDGMLISYGGLGGVTVVDGSLASGDVTIPDGVTRIEHSSFWGCRLTSVTIPDSVTDIGDGAFDAYGLMNVTIGSGVSNIGRSAFGGYDWVIHCSLTSISVVAGNPNYTSVNGLLLSKDGRTLVQGVNGDVIIPDGVTSIGECAFRYCSGLTSVTIPDSVTNIGDRAFYNCYGLTGELVLPNGVTSIGESAFNSCSGLTSVTIPDGVTSIGEYVFEYCEGLTSVVIPDSVKGVGYEAFYECDNLAAVTIGSGVTNIGENAFRECPRLGKVTFRGNEPSVDGNYAFYGVASYCTVYVPRNATFNVDAGGGWMGMKVEYYDLEDDDPVTPDPVTHEPVNPGPVTPGYDAIDEKDIVAPYEVPKAVTLQGVVYDGGGVVGIVELKLGKVNAKKKTGKVSGSVTTLDGKKHAIKAVNVTEIDGATPKAASLDVKDFGTMSITIGGTQFAGSMGTYHVQSAVVGGAWSKGGAKVYVDVVRASLPAGALEDLLPNGEPVVASGGKWKFAKAASVKWGKPKKGAAQPEKFDEESGKGLVVDTSGDKTNLSGMKLTYTPKKGTFKGSFKAYALEGSGKATKLKKYTVKVSGVVVGGVGYGEATCKTPAIAWSVTVK